MVLLGLLPRGDQSLPGGEHVNIATATGSPGTDKQWLEHRKTVDGAKVAINDVAGATKLFARITSRALNGPGVLVQVAQCLATILEHHAHMLAPKSAHRWHIDDASCPSHGNVPGGSPGKEIKIRGVGHHVTGLDWGKPTVGTGPAVGVTAKQ